MFLSASHLEVTQYLFNELLCQPQYALLLTILRCWDCSEPQKGQMPKTAQLINVGAGIQTMSAGLLVSEAAASCSCF